MPLSKTLIAALVLTAAASAQAGAETAASALPDAIAACAAIDADAERLACYDRQNPPRKAARTTNPPGMVPGSGAGAVASSVQARAVDTSPGREPRRAAGSSNRNGAEEPRQIVARVESVSERPGGELLLYLDNGQVWMQTERHGERSISPGEAVRITRGALGGHLLTAESVRGLRVKRVK